MESLRIALGHTIRELRASAGYSQEKFAVAAGVHRTFMGNLERGDTNPSLETLEGVAAGLGLKVWQLLEQAERRQND
jgi:transcriptional regulator with XRE-family HTH domain